MHKARHIFALLVALAMSVTGMAVVSPPDQPLGTINGDTPVYDLSSAFTNLVTTKTLEDIDTSYERFGTITNINQSVQYVSITSEFPTNLTIEIPKSGQTKDWLVYILAVTNVSLTVSTNVTWWSTSQTVFNDIQPNRPTALYFSQVANDIYTVGRVEMSTVAPTTENEVLLGTRAILGAKGEQTYIRSIKSNVNAGFCRPTKHGQSLEYAPTMFAPNPKTPTEQEYNEHGWYRNAVLPPEAISGKIVARHYYYIEDNEVKARYEYEDAPVPPRTFVKANLELALFEAGYLKEFNNYLDATYITNSLGEKMSLRRIYDLSSYIQEDSQYFVEAKEALQKKLGISDGDLERVLTAAYEGKNNGF